ncbi:tagaturonate reductase [Rhizobium sp. SG_E_25_P2]|jgi:tagaturonate reductase|uniref:mannitol dehydrogenase family protein n=1 Tax=Rhizobium sp. SG_E_25_P2 TaxID=2879942 RepID=UPI00247300BF|nr:mannitol dehydrogenase family protein [Rhizobium sp. SG_E_25_P2]MDH6269327.1 tagaturonate reductase [Rhizobium sp. SG_E_25_P2]
MTTPILQFGTSRFLQAHADLFVSEALERGEALGSITIVQTTRSGERSRRLTALAAPEGFPVRIRGLSKGETVDDIRRVTSVRRALSIHDDWTETARIFSDEALVVICNTGDAGYDIGAEANGLPDGVPESFPGKLTKLLLDRFEKGGAALTILPAELISRNGDALKTIVIGLARRWRLPQAFRDWLDQDVVFSNTLVDRIVSEPIEPAGAVAEPYALWAIETRPGQTLPCLHPDIVAAADISSYERLKLFILNLGHTVLTETWLASDLPRDMVVRELLARPDYLDFLEDFYAQEIIPGFAHRGMKEAAEAYALQTIERFRNPFLDHRLSDIAQNHLEKIRRRAGGFLDWTGASAPTLENMIRKADQNVQ